MIPTTNQWLDLVAAKLEMTTGRGQGEALAKALSTTKQAISAQRNNKNAMSPEQAARAARLLEIAPIIVIASCLYEIARKEGKEADASLWAEIYARNSGLSLAELAQRRQITFNGISAAVPGESDNQSATGEANN